MNEWQSAIAPFDTRLGQLQRGRGLGFLRALADGRAAHEDLLECVLNDPRVDRQVEDRARYYAELLVAIVAPIEPVVDGLRGAAEGVLAQDVLVEAWQLGHAPTRALLESFDTDEAIVEGVARGLWDSLWASPDELPPRAASVYRQLECEEALRAREDKDAPAPAIGTMRSVDQLLRVAERHPRLHGYVVDALVRLDSESVRQELADSILSRSQFRTHVAGRALGRLGDERMMPIAQELFAREDVFTDPNRRLPNSDRFRRATLNKYVQSLPEARQLELARTWRDRGGYFRVVVGGVFRKHATEEDRAWLEDYIRVNLLKTDGHYVAYEVEALARIGSGCSAELLAETAEQVGYSYTRTRAIRGLAKMTRSPRAFRLLREALWDCEEQAAKIACSQLPDLDQTARGRIGRLARHPLVERSLRAAARRRLRR